jgi:hypothetical protein
MAEERIEHGKNPETEFEHRDLGAKGIYSFLLGLAVFGVIIHFVLAGMYSVLDTYERKHQPPLNPLSLPVEPQKRELLSETRNKFPEPRLEVNERTELRGVILSQEQRLNSYGWVDEKSGIVHIPIERAMQMIAQRGLPTRAQVNQQPQRDRQMNKGSVVPMQTQNAPRGRQ